MPRNALWIHLMVTKTYINIELIFYQPILQKSNNDTFLSVKFLTLKINYRVYTPNSKYVVLSATRYEILKIFKVKNKLHRVQIGPRNKLDHLRNI